VLLLVHYNQERVIFINLDVAKGKGGFSGIVYHIDGKLGYLKPRKKIILLLY
jgi:hypothetical protein